MKDYGWVETTLILSHTLLVSDRAEQAVMPGLASIPCGNTPYLDVFDTNSPWKGPTKRLFD